jgi:flagellar protein FliO/FliZ
VDTLFLALRVIVSLAAVLAVIWYAHKRLTRGSRAATVANPITVISRQGLSPKSSVVIIEAEGKRFVLGVTEHNVSVLYERDEVAVAVAEPAERFALALVSATDELPSADGQPGRRRDLIRTPASQGMLRGSILSAETWKLSFAALRQGLK